jgi:O-antigen ligase
VSIVLETNVVVRDPEGRGAAAVVADLLVFLLFAAVPLAASTAFWDQFASVKWYVLQGLAVAWFLVELLLCGSRGCPSALRRAWLPTLALFALPLPGALRLGLDWAAPPLAERLTVLGLALAAFWYFRRNGCDLGAVRAGLLVGTAVTCPWGLAQALGVQPWPLFTAGDGRSALFGNVNMAAEFLGFATLALLVIEAPPLAPRQRLAREALLAFAFAELFFLASRSAFLATGLALALLLALGRITFRRLASLLLAATVGGTIVLWLGARLAAPGGEGGAEHLLRADVQQHKRDSSSLRFAAWDSTMALIRDHPLGVGVGNFPDAFIPYQLEGSPRPSESLYFRSPHNEALRLVADGGVFALPLALALAAALGLALWRSPVVARGRSEVGALLAAGFTFYLVEAGFQFPLDVAMGSLAIAVLLGLAAACLEPAAPLAPPTTAAGSARRAAWIVSGLLAASLVGLVAWRVARSEGLYVNAPKDLRAQAEACRLNPRNLPACVTAAWLQGGAGDNAAAQATLTRVLERSPYYFPAVKLLGEQALALGERERACRYLWIYDEMFRRKSGVHHLLGRHCEAAWLESFRATIPMPRYGVFPFAS